MENMSKHELTFTTLGLLGPAGSGKDLVADWFVETQNYVKVAFADPMKRFVMRTFNLTWEQLWGPSSERNREFEVEDAWWFEVIGHFGSGSYELVNAVLDEGVRTVGFLKLHDWLTALRRDYRNKISTRVILQTLGTEWGRAVDPLMWAKYTYKTVEEVSNGHFYTQIGGVRQRRPGEVSTYAGAVIPDHRFVNEIEMTQTRGGYVTRLRRLANEPKDDGNVGIQGHATEHEMRSIPDSTFDLVLELEEGIDKVHDALEKVVRGANGPAWEAKRWTDKSPS
jgi:hypothetical protein